MSYKYFPHTADDINRMLATVGCRSIDDLYKELPSEVVMHADYDLPEALSEKEIRDYFAKLGKANKQLKCFAGAGFYDHYAPSVIPNLLSRSEFLTSYTPYQAEVSQGTLQYIFEFQSMIATLTGMDVANASMYDGATATAEAMMMAVAAGKKRRRVLLSATLNPATAAVVKTYARYQNITIEEIEQKDGSTDLNDLKIKLAQGDVAGVIVAQPNFYGIVEDFTGCADLIHGAKALFIMSNVASNLGVLRSPGEWGADIAVGDGQSLGIPLSYGGPYVGFLATRQSLIRKMPGRIVGATVDVSGKRAFVLTLQAREQHIRREKATSNICSNQSLMAFYTTIYMSLLGADGLKEVNAISYSNAHYLADALQKTGKVKLCYPSAPFVNEFAATTTFEVDELLEEAMKNDILAGVKLDKHTLLIAATEMLSKEDIDQYINIVNNL